MDCYEIILVLLFLDLNSTDFDANLRRQRRTFVAFIVADFIFKAYLD
jgi:hypothetical protein